MAVSGQLHGLYWLLPVASLLESTAWQLALAQGYGDYRSVMTGLLSSPFSRGCDALHFHPDWLARPNGERVTQWPGNGANVVTRADS